MPNSSRKRRHYSIKPQRSSGSTKNSLDTYSSKLLLRAILDANTVPERKSRITWIMGYLLRLSMKHQPTDRAHSRCICLANPCSTLKLLKQLNTSKIKIAVMSCFLPRTARYYTDLLTTLSQFKLTKLSGLGDLKQNSAPH